MPASFNLTEQQIGFIKEHNGKMSYSKMAKEMGISQYNLKNGMTTNNIERTGYISKGSYEQLNCTLTEEQKNFLIDNRDKMTISQIAKVLNLTKAKITHNAIVLKLRKEPPLLAPVFEIDGYFNVENFGKYYTF